MQAETLERIDQETRETAPYPPSFVDRFMRFVERLPGPYWLTYLLFFILESGVTQVVAWSVGMAPAFTFQPILLIYSIWLWFPLAAMTHLNSISVGALDSFRPLLGIEADQLKRLKYEFTTMPARPVILSTVFWVLVYVAINLLTFRLLYETYRPGPVFGLITLLEGLASYSIGGALYYHSVRQLRLVDRTVQMVQQFNLFRLDPVYAFSRVTARTGMAWVILLSLTVACFPMRLANGVLLALYTVQLGLALAAFVLPLRSVHQRLVAEKRQLLAALDQRVESTLARLHQSIDGDKLGNVAELNDALTGLNAERDILNRISTWPWRTSTLTAFLSAIILPILLLFIQIGIEAWLGR